MKRACPGCGLEMPLRENATCDSYYNTTPECWSVYTEVLAAEYANAPLFGRVHQLTVDAYASQHVGGPHPDKSTDIHLIGLHLVLDRGIQPMNVPPLLQQVASSVSQWPHFEAPGEHAGMTVFDVALAADAIEHGEKTRAWAEAVWRTWRPLHSEIAAFAAQHVTLD